MHYHSRCFFETFFHTKGCITSLFDFEACCQTIPALLPPRSLEVPVDGAGSLIFSPQNLHFIISSSWKYSSGRKSTAGNMSSYRGFCSDSFSFCKWGDV